MLNIDNRVKWLQDKVKAANAKGLAIAISGGIDSAVVAALAKKAFPKEVLGVFLDIDSSTSSRRNYLRIINYLDIPEFSIDMKKSYDYLIEDLFVIEDKYSSLKNYEEYEKTGVSKKDDSMLKNPNIDQIKGNIKARLRMTAIYAYAQQKNYLVLETSNLSEMLIGYYTKWGDGAGDLAPVTDLHKSEIYLLAKELGIPSRIIDTPPSADLWEGQTDENEMGFTYDDLENYYNGKNIDSKIKDKIEKLIKRNAHKKIGVLKFENED